ncbi:MAG: glucoronyl hydrolase, partial [Butyrivibrio sp.]|nr:glucoronyl hydrolase [Butyrivibrio sp.]
MQYAAGSVFENLKTFTDKFQNAYSENGFYQPIDNNYWTTGFWTGEIWLAYEYAKEHDV